MTNMPRAMKKPQEAEARLKCGTRFTRDLGLKFSRA